MRYRLASSMSSRIDFDNMSRQSGWETASYLPLEDLERMSPGEINDLAAAHWEVTVDTIDVDDAEEAEARWLSAWTDGFVDNRESRRLDESDE